MPPRRRRALVLIILAAASAITTLAADPDWIARGRSGMVAADSPEASQIGADVLKSGGNAFDAAVATSLALAVARPQSTGLGGGGFMIAYLAKEDRFIALDFRETAPAAATPELYANSSRSRAGLPSASEFGGKAVAVPGQLAGLAEINKRFGTRPLKDLIQPAIALANDGFAIDRHFINSRDEVLGKLGDQPSLMVHFAPLMQMISPGDASKVGDKLRRPGLAKALRLIAQLGPDAFYHGPLAAAIAQAIQSTGGVLTLDDLANYRVVERKPIRFTHLDGENEFELVVMPPPSSGGVCTAETLNIIQACSVRSDLHPVEDRPHVLIEALKHAFADRARWLGDPDFCEIPLKRLVSKRYAAERAQQIAFRKTLPPAEYGTAPTPPDDGGTSHFCVVDKEGNVVAITETINGFFGSFVVAEPFGIVLNNEMDDFLTVPGEANMFGLEHSDANLVGPGKRPLSSMSPTIVLKDKKPILALGAAGGPRIITSTLQVAQSVMRGDDLQTAMSNLRIHHQWKPDEVFFDREPPPDLAKYLRDCGHQLSNERKTGVVQAIQILEDGTLVGASDPEKGGRPAAAE